MKDSKYFEENDVLFRTSPGEWNCYCCKLDPKRKGWVSDSFLDAIEHLKAHENAGHEVGYTQFWWAENALIDKFKENPTPENIETAMKMFFSEDSLVKHDISYFFLCSSKDWEKRFLDTLEPLDFLTEIKPLSHHRKINIYSFLSVVHCFHNSDQVLRILKTWEKGMIKLVDCGYIDLQDSRTRLRYPKHTPMRIFYDNFFQDSQPEFALDKIRDAIQKLCSK